MQLVFIIAILFKLSTAPPNPVTDNETDESVESRNYRYPDIENSLSPYWRAYGPEYRHTLKEHDRLELNVLKHVRYLDFKLREAWTVTDKPFEASH